MAGPLDGVRVIDVTSILLGPYASQLLGDLGADVIKIESPPKGDSTRYLGPSRSAGMSGPFINLNRNKRSLALDLKQPAAKDALRRLTKTADVFLHNMRPNAIGRLGFGYDEVAKLKPDIVYCGAYGYSQKGPYKAKPAYDDLIQGASGYAALAARLGDEPRFAPTVIADKLVGLTASHMILAALFHRQRTGEGQFVEVPMFETMVSFLMVEHLYAKTFEPPLGPTGYARLMTPWRKPYRTKDGYVCILPYSDKQWAGFFEIAGRPQLKDDPRFKDHSTRTTHVDAIYRILAEAMLEKSTDEWVRLAEQVEIPVAKVNDLDDLLEDEHLKAVGLFQSFDHPTEGRVKLSGPPAAFSRTPAEISRQAPRFGENGAELLRELGYSEAEVASLRDSGALVEGEPK